MLATDTGPCPFVLEDLDELLVDTSGEDCFQDFADMEPPATSRLEQIEDISNMQWVSGQGMNEPSNKYCHKATLSDPEIFRCTPMKAFLRYVPLVFWKQVSQNISTGMAQNK